MSLDKVQSAISSKITEIFPDLPIAYENVSFDPPDRSKWALFHFSPGTPEPASLGASGRDRVDGFAQLDLCYPTGQGGGEARKDFELLRADLPAGTKLFYEGQVATVRSTGRAIGRVLDGWYRVHVTIFWYAYLRR